MKQEDILQFPGKEAPILCSRKVSQFWNQYFNISNKAFGKLFGANFILNSKQTTKTNQTHKTKSPTHNKQYCFLFSH